MEPEVVTSYREEVSDLSVTLHHYDQIGERVCQRAGYRL